MTITLLPTVTKVSVASNTLGTVNSLTISPSLYQGGDLLVLTLYAGMPNGRVHGTHPDRNGGGTGTPNLPNLAWIGTNSTMSFPTSGSWTLLNDVATATVLDVTGSTGSSQVYGRQMIFWKIAAGTVGAATTEPSITVTGGDSIFRNDGRFIDNSGRQQGFMHAAIHCFRGATSAIGTVASKAAYKAASFTYVNPFTPQPANPPGAALNVIAVSGAARANSGLVSANGWSGGSWTLNGLGIDTAVGTYLSAVGGAVAGPDLNNTTFSIRQSTRIATTFSLRDYADPVPVTGGFRFGGPSLGVTPGLA